MGYDELEATRLDIAFCTHLHSDHTAGLPDLLLTPWVVGRDAPLELYGPPGLEKMARHVVEAWHEDIQVRVKGNQPHEDLGWQVRVHEVEPGKIYDDGVVEVTAFEVAHGAWETAYAYRFDASDRSVVISGDTTPTDAIVEACDGCDVLVHEVYAKRGFDMRDPGWQEYHRSSHTSSLELAEIATRAKPKLLVLYHQLLWGATREELMDEIRSGWDGEVAWADDLDVF